MKWLFLFSVVVWLSVVFLVDPTHSGLSAQIAFYVSLVGSIFFGVRWVGYHWAFGGDDESVHRLRKHRLSRWGALLALLAIGILILQQFHVLLWWIGLLWLAFVLLLELILYHGETK